MVPTRAPTAAATTKCIRTCVSPRMTAKPMTSPLVRRITPHKDQGGPVLVRAMISRSVRAVLSCFRESRELSRKLSCLSSRGWMLSYVE